MAKIEINNFNIADLEIAIKNVLQETVINAVKEQISPNKKIVSLFSREETAKTLCISLPTLNEWTKSGIIKAFRIGGRVLYKLEHINDALTEVKTSVKRGGFIMLKKKNDYSVIVFLENEKKPKKWEFVHKLNGFSMFLSKKHPTWLYMNVYERRNRKFLKQFKKGVFVPPFIE